MKYGSEAIMVKTPKTRHSKSRREPLTIELDPADVSRVSETEAPVAGEETASFEAAAPIDQAAPLAQVDEPLSESPAEPELATETGTATPPEQDYQPTEAVQAASSYRFDESEAPAAQPRKEPAENRAPPPPPNSGFSRVAAGIVGAVVALAGAGALQYAGLLGAPGGAADSAEVATLRQEVAAIKAGGGSNVAAHVDELTSGLDAVKADVAALKESLSAGAGGEVAGLQALDGRIKEIETSIANLGQGGATDTAGLSELGERVATVETLAKSANDAVAAADGKLTTLETSVGGLTSRVDAQAQQPKIALAITSAALKSAIERGAPFSAELETFAAITPNAPQIAALRPYAAEGVPARADITAAADTAVNAMLASTEAVATDQGFFDRLLNSAEKMVTVKRVGEPEGPGVPETLARMESAVKRADYGKALAEYSTLPKPVQDAGADFAAKLKARLDVETQLDALIAGAMKA
jgi:hypothetical protein